ncbi:MAG TPA: hypothetical protein VEJ84_06080, partial [Acidimicrobiales bacterium]|nr:hypothetical protein [Acidimicrobiales bacterium]
IASGFKYVPLGGPGLVEGVVQCALEQPRLAFVAGGPSLDERWSLARQVTGGRVTALGVVSATGGLLAAADLYIDSAPVGSDTSILEAAAVGLPTLSMFTFEGDGAVLGANSPGLDAGHTLVRDVSSLATEVSALVDDPDERARRGQLGRQCVMDQHSGPAWEEALQSAYARAAAVDRAALDDLRPQPPTDVYNRILVAFNRNAGLNATLGDHLGRHPLAVQALADQQPHLVCAVGTALGQALATTAEARALLAAAQVGRVEVPQQVLEGPEGLAGQPITVVAPEGWATHPGWVATALTSLVSGTSNSAGGRLVLPLPSPGPGDVDAAVAMLMRTLHDIGLDPESLPFPISVGDAPPEPTVPCVRVYPSLEAGAGVNLEPRRNEKPNKPGPEADL